MRPKELNIHDYWRIILKRKYTLLGILIGVTLAVLCLSIFLAPAPQFEASTRVKFDKGTSFEGLLVQAVSYSYSDEMGSQAELIRSFSIIEKMGQDIGLLPEVLTPDFRATEAYLHTVYDLQSQVRAQKEGDTNVIKITVMASQGTLASAMANGLAKAYRDDNIASRNRFLNKARQFAEAQMAKIEAHLREAEEAVRRFKEENERVLLTEEARKILDRITRLESQYHSAREAKREAATQLEKLKQGESQPDLQHIFTKDPNQILYKINLLLGQAVQERERLLIAFTAEHPKVKVQDKKINSLKNEIFRELHSKIEFLSEKEDTLETQISHYREQYRQVPESALRLARLEREVNVNSQLYNDLRLKHQEMMINSSPQISEVSILEPSVIPHIPTNQINPTAKILIGAVLGLFLGLVGTFLQESLDDSIHSPQDFEQELKIALLGMIPRFSLKSRRMAIRKKFGENTPQEKIDVLGTLFCVSDPQSRISEILRGIRSNFLFARGECEDKTILFSSLSPGNHSPSSLDSISLVNVGLLLAEDGKRVLVIDANFRNPSIHHCIGLEEAPGLSDALIAGNSWREYLRTTTDMMMGPLGIESVLTIPEFDFFDVLTAGTPCSNPAKLLGSKNFDQFLEEMRAHYDYVLLHGPPILPVTDSSLFSSQIDGVILFCPEERVGRKSLQQVRGILDRTQARVLGVILTQATKESFAEYQSEFSSTHLVRQS